MSLTNSNGPASLGVLGMHSLIPLAPLVNIISEWAAIIPLVCHLASFQHSHQLIGNVALTGRLHVGLFPKLGVTSNIAQFLEHGSEYIDRASNTGSTSQEVWDVNWGSTFPCANGAAISMILAYALKGLNHEIFISGTPASARIEIPQIRPKSSSDTKNTMGNLFKHIRNNNAFEIPATTYRRYQKLHVLHFRRIPTVFSWRLRMYETFTSFWWDFALVFLLVIGTVILCLYGLFGTAAALMGATLSKITCRFLRLRRPPGFLTNNETHDACMLVAVHRNSSAWYLYIGDRAIVDYLLNKPMIAAPVANRWLLAWFKLAHVVQLLAMTFVAAQKGWDGVAMFVLMLVDYLSSWNRGVEWLARQWLETHGVSIDAKIFQFWGRTQMINAIQAFNGSGRTSWMDDIIVPHPRRDAVLSGLDLLIQKKPLTMLNLHGFSEKDTEWVILQAQLACESAETIRREFSSLNNV